MPSNNRQAGFTIVELLIVVVVIAVLAAISTAAYTNIQNRSYNSVVESDIATIIRLMDIKKVDLGRYPTISSEFPDDFKFSKAAYHDTANNIYYIVDRDTDRYAFGLRSKSGRGYIINNGVMMSGVGTVSSGTTAAALGISWGTSNDPANPPLRSAIQGYSGSNSIWSASWKWTN